MTVPSVWALAPDALGCFALPPLGALTIKSLIDTSSAKSTSDVTASSFLFAVSVFGEVGSVLIVTGLALALQGRWMTANVISKRFLKNG